MSLSFVIDALSFDTTTKTTASKEEETALRARFWVVIAVVNGLLSTKFDETHQCVMYVSDATPNDDRSVFSLAMAHFLELQRSKVGEVVNLERLVDFVEENPPTDCSQFRTTDASFLHCHPQESSLQLSF